MLLRRPTDNRRVAFCRADLVALIVVGFFNERGWMDSKGPNLIEIRGARTHNLRNIDVLLPRDRLIVITGPSGSGKSSLAFDTIYAEGQRRYVESLSAYARQFLSVMEKPDVDHIEGLSPAIAIEQKTTSHNPRSTVGTITEIHDYLRLLYARVGEPHCPDHDTLLQARTISQMVDQVMALEEDTRIMVLSPVVQGRKGEYVQLIQQLRGQGYVRARVNGKVIELDQPTDLDQKRKHDIEVVIDRLRIRPDIQQRLADSLGAAIELSGGLVRIAFLDSPDANDLLFSSRFACPQCGYSIADLEPRMFSFNNPQGACPDCDGLGFSQFFDPDRIIRDPSLTLGAGAITGWDRRNVYSNQTLTSLGSHFGFDLDTRFDELTEAQKRVLLLGSGEEKIRFRYVNSDGRTVEEIRPFEGLVNNFSRRYKETDSNAVREYLSRFINSRECPACGGSRLRREARHVYIDGHDLPEIVGLSIAMAHSFFSTLDLPGTRGEIATAILREIRSRLGFLVNVGLDYLSLGRSAETLSGGEGQRIRLASQIGAGLVGVIYVLDEPSIGLHQRDNQRLLATLEHLRDLGNTVLVIEHDEEAIRRADHVVDLGPGAGAHGGRIVAQGTPDEVANHPDSPTGQYLSGRKSIRVPESRHLPRKDRWLRVLGASGNNLKQVDAGFPLGLFTCVTGVSGSGKSTLVNDTLHRAVARRVNRAKEEPAAHTNVEGIDHIDKVVCIDQSPIGRTPRSNPATYTGLFSPIRELFAGTQESRARGYSAGRFSFNVKGGRCEACEGDGLIRVEMHFLADVYVLCDVCEGRRYNRETLEVKYKGAAVNDILDMTVEEALPFFDAIPSVRRRLQTLHDVGLGYIRLGQSATTMSGGEAQRVKLSKELSKRDTGDTLYILDEPTTGLHFSDVELLLRVLHKLRDQGNTVVVIEHNLDVIKTADWVIDLGPEGGDRGGEVIATGSPEALARTQASFTGQFLRNLLPQRPKIHRAAPDD